MEGCNSFALYGAQSLLVLYLVGRLLHPASSQAVLGLSGTTRLLRLAYGPLETAGLATTIVGLFGALIYATPILGGLLADRQLGRGRTVLLGLVLQSLGYLLLCTTPGFLAGLLLVAVALGCTGSLKAQLGALYASDDPARADGYQLFTASASAAVIAAPLVCGTLGERFAWRWGFAAATAASLLGLAVYRLAASWLPPDPHRTTRAARREPGPGPGPEPKPGGPLRLVALLGLLPVLALAVLGNMEVFDGYLIWARRSYALAWHRHPIPVSWLLSFDAMTGIATMLLSVLFWRWWGRRWREPDELAKMGWAAVALAAAPLVLALASARHPQGRIGLGWAVAFHLLNNFGFSNLYPAGLSLFYRAAPRGLAATLVNAYALHLFLADLILSWLATLLGRIPPARFWLLHALLVGVAALVLIAARSVLSKVLQRGGTKLLG